MNTIGSFSSFSERLQVYRSQTQQVEKKFTNALNAQEEEILAEKKLKAISQSDTKTTVKNVVETAKSLQKIVTAEIEGEYVTLESEEIESAKTGLERLNLEYGVAIKEAMSLKRKTIILDKESNLFYNVLAATLQHEDAKIRSETISNFFMAETLPEKIIPNFIKALQDNDKQVRLNAALALSEHIILPDSGIEILLDALENAKREYDAIDRVCAVCGLGRQYALSGKENILIILYQVLQDNNEKVRLRAAIDLSAYISLPDVGIKILLDAFENVSGEYSDANRINATLGLGKQYELSKKENILVTLHQALQDNNKQVRLRAAIALCEYITLSDGGIQILLDAFENTSGIYDEIDRSNATFGLGKQYELSKKENILSILNKALQDNNEQVRLQAAIALGEYITLSGGGIQILLDAFENTSGIYDAIDRVNVIWVLGNQYWLSKKENIFTVLQNALQDNNEQVKLRAAVALSKYIILPDSGVKILLNALENASGKYDVIDRINATLILGKQYGLSQKENILAILQKALQDNNEQVRLRAAIALSEYIMLSNREIKILLDAFDNINGEYSAISRANAICGLGKQYGLSKKENILSTLYQALHDNNEQVRLKAAIALCEYIIMPDSGIQILMDAFENKSGKYDAIDRANATFGLGEQYRLSEKANILAALKKALQDNNEQVRLRAATALSEDITLSYRLARILLNAFANTSEEYSETNISNVNLGLDNKYDISEKENILAKLQKALQHDNGQVRLKAATYLSECLTLSDSCIKILLNALENISEEYSENNIIDYDVEPDNQDIA